MFRVAGFAIWLGGKGKAQNAEELPTELPAQEKSAHRREIRTNTWLHCHAIIKIHFEHST